MRDGSARRWPGRCCATATRSRASTRTPSRTRGSRSGSRSSWEDAGGQFTVGTALEIDALIAAGIERADVFVASTDGDNTNIIIAQIAKRRFNVPTVIARILDPYRAEWYEKQGLHTICPTRVAIDMLESEVARRGRPAAARPVGGVDHEDADV